MHHHLKADAMNPVSVALGTLDHDGESYIKIFETKQRYKYVSSAGKKDVRLWICAKKDASLPAQLFIVPEIL